MNKKLIAIFTVILIFLCCLSVVSADNESDTGDVVGADDSPVETDTPADTDTDKNEPEIDLSNYITALSLGSGAIQFSDGYTGFKMDSSKEDVSDDDGFTAEGTSSAGSNGNYFKLAVIESYKAGRENDIDSVIASFADGSYQSSSDPVVQAVLASDETIGDNAVVKIDNTTEATFDFEVLTPVDDKTSSYFAYTVSMATVEDQPLSSPQSDDVENDTLTSNDVEDDTAAAPDTENDTLTASDTENDTLTSNDVENDANATLGAPQQDEQSRSDTTVVNQTNKTVVNKENTTIINEKNTTVVNKNNVVAKQPPKQPQKQPPVHERIMKAAGNPIFILVAVVVLGGAIAIVLRKKR